MRFFDRMCEEVKWIFFLSVSLSSLFSFRFIRFFVRLCPAVYLYCLDVCRSSNAQAKVRRRRRRGEREKKQREENTHTDIIRYLIYHYDYFLLSARFLIDERKEKTKDKRDAPSSYWSIHLLIYLSRKAFHLMNRLDDKILFLPFRSSSLRDQRSINEEKKKRQLIRCRHHTRACECACVCVFVLTVAVFPSDIEKMGCVRNCATYLSFDLTCVLDGHLDDDDDDDDATGLCFEWKREEKDKTFDLPNIFTSEQLTWQ